MRTLTILLIALIVLGSTSCSKSSNGNTTIPAGTEDNFTGGNNIPASAVPAAVMNVFNTRYPDAAQVQWKLLNTGNYKAEFFRGAVKWQTTFTATGSIVTEQHA